MREYTQHNSHTSYQKGQYRKSKERVRIRKGKGNSIEGYE